jgi:signal transduction histidine kinase/DNA-binding response OmpR family regulator
MTAGVDTARDPSRRVLLAAPTVRDAEVTTAILGRAGVECLACNDIHRLAREIESGVGAILLTGDALGAIEIDAVAAALDREPAWSEPPIVLLLGHLALAPASAKRLRALRNVTMLERPVPIRTLVSAIEAALRARQRQYEIRDQIRALEHTEQVSRQLQQQLELAVDASELGTFHCAIPLGKIVWNDRCKAHFWLPPTAEVDFDLFYSILHPDDRDSTRRAIDACVNAGAIYDVEYRTLSPDGETRWVRATGRTYRDAGGKPFRFDGTTQDITPRKRHEQEANAADRRKDEFLAMLAHELRNPLTPIHNAVDILRSIGSSDRRINATADMIGRQVQHLVRLVDDLLDVSRVTQGKVTLRMETLDLGDVIQRGVELARALVEQRQHVLAVTLPPPGESMIRGDVTRLAQVFGNLLDNAAKYTDVRGRIAVTVTREAGRAVIRVTDNGVGIAPDLLPRVFDLFIQSDRSLDRAQGGLGIGLSLVKSLVGLHGGRVEARSEGHGKGSEFIVELPALESAANARVAVAAQAAAVAETSRRILVVDDSIDAMDSLRTVLEMHGHCVRCANSAEAALEVARSFRPEVAVLDIGLPGMDGFELARRLRRSPANADVVLIALTGYGQAQDRARTRAAGFHHHLTKPADLGALVEFIGTPVNAAREIDAG